MGTGLLSCTEGIKLRLIKSLLSSNSRYAVLMITELFNLDQQINHPGTADGDNWRFRLPWTLADIRSSLQLSGDGNKLAAIISITRRGGERVGFTEAVQKGNAEN